MTLSQQLQNDIKEAMKAKEKDRLTVLRGVKAAMVNKEIELGRTLEPQDEVALVLKLLKQRKEAAEGFRKGGAEEKAQQEEWEATLLEGYLPAPPSDQEIEDALEAEIALLPPEARQVKSLGAVMKALQARFAGRPLDGKVLSAKVKARLS